MVVSVRAGITEKEFVMEWVGLKLWLTTSGLDAQQKAQWCTNEYDSKQDRDKDNQSADFRG